MDTTSTIIALTCLGLLAFAVIALVLGIVAVCKKHQEMEQDRREDDARTMKMLTEQCLAISEHNLDYLRSQRDNPERVPAPSRFNGTPAPTVIEPQEGFNPAF